MPEPQYVEHWRSVSLAENTSLPEDHMMPSKPTFTFTGVICFGPFEVRHGRLKVKRYGVIFSYLALHTVHMEVVSSLDTVLYHCFAKICCENRRWAFNAPAASHHGGVCEWCICIVPTVLRGLIKEQILDDEGLSTLMCEVEAIVMADQ